MSRVSSKLVRPMEEWELVLDCYVDASWGSEKNVDRKSISGGCVMLGSFCLKAWSRLQQAVALSSLSCMGWLKVLRRFWLFDEQ